MKKKNIIFLTISALLLILHFIPMIKYSIAIRPFEYSTTYYSMFTKIFTPPGGLIAGFIIFDILYLLTCITNMVVNVVEIKKARELKVLNYTTFAVQLILYAILLVITCIIR